MAYTGRQLHNDTRDLEAIAEGYSQKLEWAGDSWLAYALQKDAIQNSWDARINKDWGIDFTLLTTNNGLFLVISDKGTSGLTGHTWENEADLNVLIDSGESSENLAFFLSSNFSGKDSTSGGKRGRGKSLFLVASESSTFYFESLRKDGLVVFGSQYVSKNNSIQVTLTDNKNFLDDEIGNGRSKLTEPGTKIYIKNPVKTLVESFENGRLLNFIETTWWEIIKKYGANITINGTKGFEKAKLLNWYNDQYLDSQKQLSIKEYPGIAIDHEGSPKIKRIKLIYDPEDIFPDDLKGIAIQRSGMTIQRRITESLVKEEGMQKVFGWVEFEPSLEGLMYDLEDVEHLKFNWTKNPAKKINSAIQMKVRDFAKTVKLIESDLSKEHNKHKQIELDAAKKINEYLKNLGFTGFSVGGRTRGTVTTRKEMPLIISFTDFILPNPTTRVDYGQKIRANAIVTNCLKRKIQVAFRVWIVTDGSNVMLTEREYTLPPNESRKLGWDEIIISKDKFKRGEYSFRSKIIIMEDTDIEWDNIGKLEKGNDKLKASTTFSIDQDPKASGFLKFEPKEDLGNKQFYLESFRENNSVVISYNTVHPYIAQVSSLGEDMLRRFLSENGICLALNEVLAEDLASNSPKIFKDLNPSELDPASTLPIIMQHVSEFLWSQ